MQKTFFKKEANIPFTKEGYQKLLEEREKLLAERPIAVEHLRKAREMGDLSENGYYKASRAKLSFLDAQLRRSERLVKLGIIVESTGNETADIGNTVTINDGTKDFNFTIVGGYESDPLHHTISHVSPIGKALLGKKEHDIITVHAPAGDKTYTVVKIV